MTRAGGNGENYTKTIKRPVGSCAAFVTKQDHKQDHNLLC